MKTKAQVSILRFQILQRFAAALEREKFVENGCRVRFRWRIFPKLCGLLSLTAFITLSLVAADQPTAPVTPAAAPTATPPATPAPPPSAPAKVGAAELEKLLMPIALYSDSLIATLLPACVYPLEIVQAARFLQDSNNASKIDDQPWDDSVKAIAKIPAALKKLNDDLPWTIQLGEVFLNQDKDVMDMIQSLRSKAQKAGTLRTTEQQVVVVTNMVVEKTVEEKVVVVTNTVVQIQPSPSNPEVVYVPSYPPTVYAPPPSYVYNPYAPLITFGAGVAVGAIIANNCDWGHGGTYWGGGGGNDVNINNSVNIGNNNNVNRGGNRNNVNSGNRSAQGGQKWQPDANRVRSSGSGVSAKTMESRGWGSGGAGGRANAQGAAGNRSSMASTRPSTPSAGNRASTPSAANRSSTPSAGSRASTPSAGNRAAGGPASAGSSDRSVGGGRSSASPSPARTSASPSRSSGSSAFGGGGASDRQYSQRGASSRGSASSMSRGGGGSRGGGARGGGGRGR